MKKLTALTAAVAMASAMQVSANYEDSALAHVYVNVVPNISISGSSGGCTYDCGGYGGTYGDNTGGGSSYTGGSTAGLDFVVNEDLGDVMVGYIYGSVTFNVHANSQAIELACAATELFKGNVPVDGGYDQYTPHDDQIPLYEGYGCQIDVPYGNPMNGASNVAYFDGSKDMHGDWEFFRTNSIVFENNHPEPTQDITLSVKWYQADPEKRQGQYSGFVKLIAMIPQAL
ncbi:MAG: hypothetical protein HKO71_05920 [Pseudomonadales bacterium]|nr:hypothetical protein [Pseudomonadales bacterium]